MPLLHTQAFSPGFALFFSSSCKVIIISVLISTHIAFFLLAEARQGRVGFLDLTFGFRRFGAYERPILMVLDESADGVHDLLDFEYCLFHCFDLIL